MQSEVRLSFILATTGRPSIVRMLRSIRAQAALDPNLDELVIVGDYRVAATVIHDMRTELPLPTNFILCPRGENWGHSERNVGMRFATGTHLMFIDDDDALIPGAVALIKEAIVRSREWRKADFPFMFRMIDPNGAVIWGQPVIRKGNHGTPQFVVPNIANKLGVWGDRYEGDFDFVQSTLAKYPEGEDAVIWDTSVVYGCRDFGGAY